MTTDRKSVGDALSFEGYDFIYIGSGTESNQKTALRHLRDFREALVAAAESGTVILLTGNAADMMGKTVTAGDGTVYEGVGLLDFTAVESATSRITGDAICKCEWFTKPLVGFINKCSSLEGSTIPPLSCRWERATKRRPARRIPLQQRHRHPSDRSRAGKEPAPDHLFRQAAGNQAGRRFSAQGAELSERTECL